MQFLSFWYEEFEILKELVSDLGESFDFTLNLLVGFDGMRLDFVDELFHGSDFEGVGNELRSGPILRQPVSPLDLQFHFVFQCFQLLLKLGF